MGREASGLLEQDELNEYYNEHGLMDW